MKKFSSIRFWEVDSARGIAIILMVIFNWSFALHYLNVYTLDGGWVFWYLFPRLIGGMFILIAGISLTLSYSRVRDTARKQVYAKYLKRGLKVFSIGLGITLVTWVLYPGDFILFGILHLMGLSIAVSPIFFRFKNANLIIGLAIIFAGFYLGTLHFDFPWLLWLGFVPANFFTLDYFPFLPWFGFLLIGLFIGNTVYADGKRKLSINFPGPVLKHLCRLGRNSLLLYVIHQPILVGLLYLLGIPLFP